MSRFPGQRIANGQEELTHAHETVDEPLWREEVHVERVPVGRFVDRVPDTRSEGDLTVVPVLEEVAVVEKRLWLREELHIRRTRVETHAPTTVVLRREEVSIQPLAPEGTDAESGNS
jgi:uncharacterized protein (TIGR02271 family)